MPQRLTALVTGATGGIGRELCREFARHGINLVISARNKEALDQLAARLRTTYGVEVWPIAANLAYEEAPGRLYAEIKDKGIAIDILVNNAGFGLGGYFHENRPELQESILRVNAMAMTKLCRLYIPEMLAAGGGRILNIASTGSFVAGPMNAVYCASKAYVLSLSEALSEELSHTGVGVTALCPGGTATNFARRANMENTRLFQYMVLDPRTVAKAGYRALLENRRVAVVGGCNAAMMAALRFVPRIVGVKASRAIQYPLFYR